VCLFALVPSLLLTLPLRWLFTDPAQPEAISIYATLGANEWWMLSTNVALAAALAITSVCGTVPP
jgi:hypothetical protein